MAKNFMMEENKFNKDIEMNNRPYHNIPHEDRCSLNNIRSSSANDIHVNFDSEERSEEVRKSNS